MKTRSLFVLRMFVLAFGVIIAALGVWRGELSDILRKAIVVCLECVGI